MPRGERVKIFLRGLLNLVALVLVAGGVGVALGMGLSALSGDEQPATSDLGGGSTTATDAAGEPPASTSTQASAPVETATAPPATTTTAPAPAAEREPVSVSVLDARLFTDATPSGRQEQRARVTVRVRAENTGDERVTLDPPVLRVGSVRIPADPAGAQFDPLEPGTNQTVTLRFALAGEATPKVVRDRRARILIAGQSLAMRVRVQAPS
jgi:hypothetical protein